MSTPTRPHKAARPTPTPHPLQRRPDSRSEDSAIIAEALAGHDRAYQRLMDKYHDAIFNFIYRMVRDREQVEDLTQEAFIKAFASLKTFNEEYAFSTWLYKIATNNCIDYIRKKKLQMFSIDKPIESKDSDFTFELPDDSYEADREMISDQRAVMLNEAIDTAPGEIPARDTPPPRRGAELRRDREDAETPHRDRKSPYFPRPGAPLQAAQGQNTSLLTHRNSRARFSYTPVEVR